MNAADITPLIIEPTTFLFLIVSPAPISPEIGTTRTEEDGRRS